MDKLESINPMGTSRSNAHPTEQAAKNQLTNPVFFNVNPSRPTNAEQYKILKSAVEKSAKQVQNSSSGYKSCAIKVNKHNNIKTCALKSSDCDNHANILEIKSKSKADDSNNKLQETSSNVIKKRKLLNRNTDHQDYTNSRPRPMTQTKKNKSKQPGPFFFEEPDNLSNNKKLLQAGDFNQCSLDQRKCGRKISVNNVESNDLPSGKKQCTSNLKSLGCDSVSYIMSERSSYLCSNPKFKYENTAKLETNTLQLLDPQTDVQTFAATKSSSQQLLQKVTRKTVSKNKLHYRKRVPGVSDKEENPELYKSTATTGSDSGSYESCFKSGNNRHSINHANTSTSATSELSLSLRMSEEKCENVSINVKRVDNGVIIVDDCSQLSDPSQGTDRSVPNQNVYTVEKTLGDVLSSIENKRLKSRFTMVDLTFDDLEREFNKNHYYLHEICKGRRDCKRHELYKKDGEARYSLQYSVATLPFSEEQMRHILNLCCHASFCAKKDIYLYFDYFSKVLLPEACTKMLMDRFSMSHKNALKTIFEDFT